MGEIYQNMQSIFWSSKKTGKNSYPLKKEKYIVILSLDGIVCNSNSKSNIATGSKISLRKPFKNCVELFTVRRLLLGRKAVTNLDSILKSRDITANKGPSSQHYGFSSGHVWMWKLDYKESWAPKNWCFWTVVLEKTLESPLDCKEIQPVHPDQSWVFVHWKDWCWS